ncbi:hypothetical protein HRR83_005654 [Exophiala dermatitidis]|uniref:PNPLA domain-containing protein n=1 Tax=Exophiala dermatitidis TaxID=5970 RepID=A0AAN6ENK9_EXODE|nr:hypothetical protein HRR73_007513 [Exophiala dermatitidis]KAJ4510821.1 hypothetical protein HRR75_005515 [Exophiala dermatitidis]KAJ4513210.1 hypothetical protein HRR74_006022 [Exophiala dermatitidis]KAJ4531992.1 hypothetical protein HRR77_008954 [Exophiala dermatitidis]KAJ4547302.1 hypothetical protein HRR78_005402 [Exophiala dermatitidis]
MAARTNVLAFDGGGTRGLTSLLILQAIMHQLNIILGISGKTLVPRDIFDAICGTSTGGLIAIMLGRFGMSVEECIKQYDSLAQRIFSKRKWAGYLTKNLLGDKYSSKPLRQCVKELAEMYADKGDASMRCEPDVRKIPCTVITCRLHPKTREPMNEPTFLCSHTCESGLEALIWEAAHATTAAPTYFGDCWIEAAQGSYIDGGVGYNNPTYSTYNHYSDEAARNLEPKARGVVSGHYRFVSIGTGQRSEKEADTGPQSKTAVKRPRRGFRAIVRSRIGLFKVLVHNTTRSDKDDGLIRALGDAIDYVRLEGAKGVHKFPLDASDPTSMARMRKLTEEWIASAEGKHQIGQAASKLAEHYESRWANPSLPSPSGSVDGLGLDISQSHDQRLTSLLSREPILATPEHSDPALNARLDFTPASNPTSSPTTSPRQPTPDLTQAATATQGARTGSFRSSGEEDNEGRTPVQPLSTTKTEIAIGQLFEDCGAGKEGSSLGATDSDTVFIEIEGQTRHGIKQTA